MASKLDGKYDNSEDIKRAREAAKKKGNKTFTVDGLRYDTSTGRRKPLSAAPLLEATQRRIDYEKARPSSTKSKYRYIPPSADDKKPVKKSRYRYIPPSKDADDKKPVKKANGGLASAAKTIAGKTTRSRNKTKPRGVGVAMKGYGKAMR